MKIWLIDLKDPQDLVIDKTIAGGMGTATRYGNGLFTNLLTRFKAGLIRLLPYHVAYVAAQLRAQGHQVSYHTRLPETSAELAILFSAIPSLTVDGEALKSLKARGIPSLATGTIVGVAPERFADATLCLKGEPEAFFARADWTQALSSARLNPGQCLEAGLVAQLDSLPFPDWSIFPRLRSHYAIVRPLGTVLPVVTSRGCPHPCAHYCPYPLEEGRVMRYRSADSVQRELLFLRERYGVTAVKFRDPILTIHRGRALELLDALDALPFPLRWGCETHLAQTDEALLTRMARAGCRLIQTGIESTSPDVLKAAHRKSAEVRHQERMLELCQKLGIRVAIYFILGLPEDTLEGMERSLAYALTLPASFVQITLCTPYPGTAFFETVQDRLLTRDWRDLDQYTPVLRGEGFTSEALVRLMGQGYRRFYLRRDWLKGFASVQLAGITPWRPGSLGR